MHIIPFEQSDIACYVKPGAGIPLLFVHGFCEDSSVWDSFITGFPERHIIRIDLPGFGNSSQIPDPSMARYAEVVFHIIQQMEIDQLIYIGHSMGGYVGLEIAYHHPEVLRGFCLFHSHPYADTPQKVNERNKAIDFIKKNGHIPFVKQLIPHLFTNQFGIEHKGVLDQMIQKASQLNASDIKTTLEVMIGRADHATTLKNITVPTLCIIGKEDIAVPDYISESTIPDVALIHLLEEVSHMGMIEAPEKCDHILKTFVQFVESKQLTN